MFNPANFVTNHPYWSIVIGILFPNLVATMPTPAGAGFWNSTGYKWIFGFMHSLPNIPRLFRTLFPDNVFVQKILEPESAKPTTQDQAKS